MKSYGSVQFMYCEGDMTHELWGGMTHEPLGDMTHELIWVSVIHVLRERHDS